MAQNIVLTYMSSDSIKEFCTRNPIRWTDPKLANGPGNLFTPSPAIAIFFEAFLCIGRLFTQVEYVEFAWHSWGDWKGTLSEKEVAGIESRLYRNFYPSGIDSLYVWSLLVESGCCEKCVLDTADDAVGKTDITVWLKDGTEKKLALYVGSNRGGAWTKYKREHRGDVSEDLIDLVLSMDKPRSPGNKRWYGVEDLGAIIGATVSVEEDEIPY